jgi:uncharacterized protein (TIGR02996 family)
MLDESTFLSALAAHLHDDVTRLAFADWLEENDQPDKARFLREECDLHANPKDRRRLERLTRLGNRLPADWLAAVGRPRVSSTVWLSDDEIEAIGCPAAHHFRPDGSFAYYYLDAMGDPTPGEWKQFGPRVVFHIDQGQSGKPYSFHTARIHGNTMHVRSRNVAGVSWRWSMERSDLAPPPKPARSRRRRK